MSTVIACDACGKKLSFSRHSGGYYRIGYERAANEIITSYLPEPDLCSWQCIADYAQKRVSERSRS